MFILSIMVRDLLGRKKEHVSDSTPVIWKNAVILSKRCRHLFNEYLGKLNLAGATLRVLLRSYHKNNLFVTSHTILMNISNLILQLLHLKLMMLYKDIRFLTLYAKRTLQLLQENGPNLLKTSKQIPFSFCSQWVTILI